VGSGVEPPLDHRGRWQRSVGAVSPYPLFPLKLGRGMSGGFSPPPSVGRTSSWVTMTEGATTVTHAAPRP
jgi:hypothetical protein